MAYTYKLQSNLQCQICGKRPKIGNNRPHSLHKTKRLVKPNLQKYQDKLVCTRCLKKILE